MTDTANNKLRNKGGRIILEIEGRQPLELGIINKKTREFNTLIKKDEMVNVNGQMYFTLNKTFLTLAQTFDKVIISTESVFYKVPKDFLLREGQELKTNENGLLTRLFIAPEQIREYEIKQRAVYKP